MENPQKAQDVRQKFEKEAIRRLSARGKDDPRLDFSNFKNLNLIDMCREYDKELFNEINVLQRMQGI